MVRADDFLMDRRSRSSRAGPRSRRASHTLIAAPTGSGKTLAAFLVCIDRIYRAHEAAAGHGTSAAADQAASQSPGDDPVSGPSVVYVSPLKALAVDISQNLERPLAEIAEVAAELGLAGARDQGRGQDRRHRGRRAGGDAEEAAGLPDHHA